MEKKAAIILSLSTLAFILVLMNGYATFTGMITASDLPAPPAPPGFESPAPTQNATQQDTCHEDWECTDWSTCRGGYQFRDCEDDNECGTNEDKPSERRSCSAGTQTSEIQEILSQAPTTTSASAIESRLSSIEFKLKALDTLVNLEQRINTAEGLAQNVGNFDSRIASLESSIQAVQNELRRFPSQQQPFNPEELEQDIQWNTILSVSLSIFILLIICGYFASIMIQRKQERDESKRLLKQYLANYTRQGYKIETLKMHLKASGWSDTIINEVISEVSTKPL